MEKDTTNNENTDREKQSTKDSKKEQNPSTDSTTNKQPDNSQDSHDADNEKALAVISYISILWIVPLIAAEDSDFAMYHANQGLNLFIVAMVIFAIQWIPIIGWIIAPFGWIVVIIFMVLGIINAAGDKKKPLPIIGKYDLLE